MAEIDHAKTTSVPFARRVLSQFQTPATQVAERCDVSFTSRSLLKCRIASSRQGEIAA
jgi:hypothetical protein